MNEIESFIRDAASDRGIDPDIAIRVAQSEGGITEYARVGKFPTGWSFWSFQLHYGGPGYEHFGTVAGMGGDFTKLTGWQPGNPAAWRDSTRYALNRAKASGWSAWYGAAHVGIGRWDGIDRNQPWDAAAEQWDYETGAKPMPVTFDPNYPAIRQDDPDSCAPTSLGWAMGSLGRHPGDNWIEEDMRVLGLWNHESGLLDHTGRGIVQWLQINDADHYGSDGYGISNNACPISWEQLTPELGDATTWHPPYPCLLGLPSWDLNGGGHWVGIRGFRDGRILLANPATGPIYGHTSLSQQEFESRAAGNASLVRVLHPDLLANAPSPAPPPPPTPIPPTPPTPTPQTAPLEGIRQKLQEALALLDQVRL